MSKKKEYKVIMMGDSGVGKTSIIQRFAKHTFDFSMETTVGASFLSKSVKTERGTTVLNIWDTAGQEKYKSLISTYARNANAAVFVFDLTSPSSFSNINQWYDELLKYCDLEETLIFIVGNKGDLEITVPEQSAMIWAKEHNTIYMRTSARSGSGVKDLFIHVANSLLEKIPNTIQEPLPNINDLKPEKKSGCC